MLPWNVEDLTFDAERFSGKVRLFPLPDLVMFPHVMQPLHVFEQRYREMLSEALDSDGLIAMSMPAPGGKKDEFGRPVLLPQVCIGKVVSHHRLEDGRYNVMLLGMKRARIVRELPQTRSFRQAEVELIDDMLSVEDEANRAAVQATIAERFETALPLPEGAAIDSQVRDMLASEVPLGVLTDLVSFALPLATPLKHELLAEKDVDRRAAILLAELRNSEPADDESSTRETLAESVRSALPPAATQFPPPFSAN